MRFLPINTSRHSSNLAGACRTFVLAILMATMSHAVSAQSLQLRNVTLVSPNTKTEGMVNVLIKDGRIAAIDQAHHSADQIIEAEGRYLVPGLIDSHVHLQGIPGYRPGGKNEPGWVQDALAQIPKSYLYFGFTTLLDLASTPNVISEWKHQPMTPDVYFCGAAPILNGYPLSFIPDSQALPDDAIRYLLYDERQKDQTPDNINPDTHGPEVLAERMHNDGALCLKTYYETGFGPKKGLPVPTVTMGQQLVTAAHKQSMPVFLHANSQAAYEFGLDTGVDVFAHGLWHWHSLASGNDEELTAFVTRIAEAGIAVQPTLQVLHGERELFDPEFLASPQARAVMPAALVDWYRSDAGQWMKQVMGAQFGGEAESAEALHHKVAHAYQTPVGNVEAVTRALVGQKVQLLFGSDTPSGPFYTQFPGLNGYLEIRRWQDAGVNLETIFRSLTLDNARALGIDHEVGSIEVGKLANLLLLKTNPLESIEAYDSIETVILRGKPLARGDLSASP